jgi:hypothetical protein
MVVAVRAAAHELELEGPYRRRVSNPTFRTLAEEPVFASHGRYWLLLVDSEAFEMPQDMAHITDELEEGWLVVRGRWYELVQRSPRGYKLDNVQKLVLVNTMIRLPNVIFAGGSVGKEPRASRSGLHMQEDNMHNLLMSSV